MPADFPEIARALTRRPLSRAMARDAILFLCSGRATDEQIRHILLSFDYQSATLDELTGAASAMRELLTPLPIHSPDLLDTCGTGGDVRHTFNISTAAALIAAAAGVKIVKHGNRSASSKCGSADVLERLGLNLNPGPAALVRSLEQCNICFAFAAAYHPAMKHVAPIRRALGKPTLFNLLGPLTNPAHARLNLLGVFSPDLTERLAQVLLELGSRRAWVVHAADGLDEISTVSPTRISELKDGQVKTSTLDPGDLGFAPPTMQQLQVSDVSQAAGALLAVLNNTPGPHRDISVLNAAAAIHLAGRAPDLQSALAPAQDALASGKALQTLSALIQSQA